jgi:hypothetical protein
LGLSFGAAWFHRFFRDEAFNGLIGDHDLFLADWHIGNPPAVDQLANAARRDVQNGRHFLQGAQGHLVASGLVAAGSWLGSAFSGIADNTPALEISMREGTPAACIAFASRVTSRWLNFGGLFAILDIRLSRQFCDLLL